MANWVHFVGFLLLETLSLHSFQTLEDSICSSRQQYMDYIIGLYDVKNSTMSNSKCAMPFLFCLLSFYTIPISSFELEEFFYFLVNKYAMHVVQ